MVVGERSLLKNIQCVMIFSLLVLTLLTVVFVVNVNAEHIVDFEDELTTKQSESHDREAPPIDGDGDDDPANGDRGGDDDDDNPPDGAYEEEDVDNGDDDEEDNNVQDTPMDDEGSNSNYEEPATSEEEPKENIEEELIEEIPEYDDQQYQNEASSEVTKEDTQESDEDDESGLPEEPDQTTDEQKKEGDNRKNGNSIINLLTGFADKKPIEFIGLYSIMIIVGFVILAIVLFKQKFIYKPEKIDNKIVENKNNLNVTYFEVLN